MSAAVPERVAAFGPARSLVGILALPQGDPAPEAPHVVLLSTGILHRVGTGRLWVRLARALAEAGFTSLRFDYSGIGDSDRRKDVGSMREAVERDVGDAIEYLCQTQRAERVVLVGLCSGAYDALLVGQDDPRVVGAVMIDMPGPFGTWRHTFHHLLARALRPASWRNPLRKLRHYSQELLATPPATAPDDDEGYVFGSRSVEARERMHAQLLRLLARGVRLHVVFTAGLEENYNHRTQFRTTFPEAARHPRLSYAWFPAADHGFSVRAERSRLLDGIVRWAREAWGVGARAGTSGAVLQPPASSGGAAPPDLDTQTPGPR
jgi:pimeloyl-ACP methyl ester carboxylesterase